jgi:hypothetical protein
MNTTEIWKDISGYDGKYQVSNFGIVKSLARVVESRKGVFVNKKEIILNPFKNKKGYLRVKLCTVNDNVANEKSFYVHTLTLKSFSENTFCKLQVNKNYCIFLQNDKISKCSLMYYITT